MLKFMRNVLYKIISYPTYKVISIDKDENDEYEITIKITGKGLTFPAKPEYILSKDRLTDKFSPRDVRTLTYLGYLSVNSPKYKILAKRLAESDESLFFIKQKGSEKAKAKTAKEIAKNKDFLGKLDQEDAYLVGYTAASEEAIREKELLENVRQSSLEKKESEMILVTVNHHLNEEGLDFFSAWFEETLAKIRTIDGFIDIGYHLNRDESFARVIVTFENNDKLTKWANSELHLNLVQRLDAYRTKPWDSVRQAVTAQTPQSQVNKIELVGFQLCPFTQRASILLSEGNIDHEINYIDILNKPDWFFEISPLHEIPLLRVNDQFSIFKSNVICEYINDEFLLNLYPDSNYEKSRQKSWIEFGNSLVIDIFLMSIAENNDAFLSKKETVEKKLLQLEKELSSSPLSLEENFSMIDSCYIPIFIRLEELGEILNADFLSLHQNLRSWKNSLLTRNSARKIRTEDQKLFLINFLKKKNSFIVANK